MSTATGEAVLDGAAGGRVYAEVFVTPARLLAGGAVLGDILAGIEEGLAADETETGSHVALNLDMDRAFGADAGLQLLEQAEQLRRSGAPGSARIIGDGMDSTEIGVDPRSFASAYAFAGKLGLRRTGHQGQDTPASAIAPVIDVLGAERVDHGLSIAGDPELVRRVTGEGIPLTLCPSSNILIAHRVATLAEHPFPVLRARCAGHTHHR